MVYGGRGIGEELRRREESDGDEEKENVKEGGPYVHAAFKF